MQIKFKGKNIYANHQSKYEHCLSEKTSLISFEKKSRGKSREVLNQASTWYSVTSIFELLRKLLTTALDLSKQNVLTGIKWSKK